MGLNILVIEDSLVFQKIMGTVLKGLAGVEQVAVAATGAEGLEQIERLRPDVVFLDLHLPDMNGMEVLDCLREGARRQRVVVVSGLSVEGADLTIQALAKGAQQFIRKPCGSGFQQSVDMLRDELEPVIQTVLVQVGLRRVSGTTFPVKTNTVHRPMAAPVRSLPAVAPKPAVPPVQRVKLDLPARPPVAGFWVVGVAVSTGGPEALNQVIPRLPADFPLPIVMVQHMPPMFTRSLARSLDAKSALAVVEGEAGQVLSPGCVYIAPGGQHMVVRKLNGSPVLALNEDLPEQSVRPAADVLFRSLAAYQSHQAVLSVIMTGMGQDGLAGVRALKNGACHCLTQSADSCVIYGMPRSVDEAGLSDETIALADLAARMTRLATGLTIGV